MPWTASRTDEEGDVSSSDEEEELRFGGKTFQRMALEWILLGNARTDPTIDNVVFYSSAAELLVVFVDAAVLAFRLLMYSSVGIVSSFVFWLPVTQDKYMNFLRANATAHEVINIPDDKEGPFFRAFLPHWDVVWAFYFPVASLMFLVPKKRQSALIVVLTIISSLIGHAISRFYASELIGELFPILVWPFNVLVVMGSRRGQLGFMFQQLMAFLIGLSVSLTRGWTHKFIPGSDSVRRGSQVDTERIIELVVIFPILRELGYAIIKHSARSLALHKEHFGADRRFTWLFVLWFQYASALYVRIMFFRFQTDSTFAGLLIFQSLMEVSLRLTAPYRGIWMANALERLQSSLQFSPFCTRCLTRLFEGQVQHASSVSDADGHTGQVRRGRQSSVDLLVGPRAGPLKKLTTTTTLHRSQRWFAIPLVGEMLTEYAAIITGSLLVIIFRKDLLRFPIEYYAGLEEPFDTDRDTIVNDAASNAILQVVAELVVDSICISIEKQRGFDLAWVFNHRHRYFALMFFAATWFGNVALGLIISAGGDRFANCAGENMCMCAADKNGGLDEFGLRQLYCDYFQDT